MYSFHQSGNKKMQSRTLQQGVSIVEALIAIMIITVALTSILSLATLSSIVTSIAKQTTQATLFIQDTMEAVRNFRDGIDWNNDDPLDKYDGLGVVVAGALYHLEQSTDSPPRWKLLAGNETIDEFTRSVVFRNVCRDTSSDDITGITDTNGTTTTCVANGGAYDADTKEVMVAVSWQERGRSHEVELVTYLTNWNQ